MPMSTTFSLFHLPKSLLVIACYLPVMVASDLSSPRHGCSNQCGHVQITYPFGVGDGCFFPGFEITCNQSIPFIAQSDIQLLSISQGEVRINSTQFIIACERFLFSSCTNYGSIDLPQNSPYTLSLDSNKFVTIGCNATGYFNQGFAVKRCFSTCLDMERDSNGTCAGYGCCETVLPSLTFETDIHSANNMFTIVVPSFVISQNSMRYNNTHIYGFVVEDGSYDFIESDLLNFSRDISAKLEWAIGEGNCSLAKESDLYACGENSYCAESNRGYGYLCICPDGYFGNPYLSGTHGCQEGRTARWKRRGIKCLKHYTQAQVIIATIGCVCLLILCFTLLYCVQKKRNSRKLRANFFQKNGGLILQQCSFSSRGTAMKYVKIFSAQELENATDNYNTKRILCSGCLGLVYKGILKDGSIVTVKKSNELTHGQVHQFIDDIVILAQINHKNIAKFLGCCLETAVPMLVYEFHLGSTLYEKLQGDALDSTPLSWENRLQIAIDIANALLHLHSCASMPIIHRDIRSSNILLDKYYKAKVANFGVLSFLQHNTTWAVSVQKGITVYSDPEYIVTGKMTEKSDVYGFGVILVELLSGKTAFQQTQDQSSLVTHFLLGVEKGNLLKLLDRRILREERMDDLQATADIARRCLNFRGEARPTMKEVATQLLFMVREVLDDEEA